MRRLAAALGLVAAGCGGISEPVPANPPEAANAAVDEFTLEEGFSRLTLADFEPFPAEESAWREEQGILRTTGKPKGYLHSRRAYADFDWRGEFRFPQDGQPADPAKLEQSNTGFMLLIQEPHKVWPRSLEVQGKFVELGQIRPNGGVPPLTATDDAAVRDRQRRPLGEWNALKIECRGGAVVAWLNSEVIATCEATDLRSGQIGLQAENFPVEFRRLRIREVR